jgi:hypothetical protein
VGETRADLDQIRLIGHWFVTVIGTAAFAAGIAAFARGLPNVMGAVLLIVGVALPTLAWRSYHQSRAAWAFSISILAVLATVTFFGAPKIRDLLGIKLGIAMVIPVVMIAATVILVMLRDEYREN